MTMRGRSVLAAMVPLLALSCTDLGDPPAPLSSDDTVFRTITVEDPFTGWALFPRADSITAGSLNGSQAHRPFVSVRINAVAATALQGDSLPAGAAFPPGSMIVKCIIMNGATQLLAVMRKEPGHPLAGDGWLWAEYLPDGRPFISVERGGSGCRGCHAGGRGGAHDFVRTFERQHP
jgi:hypothetical protein